MNSSKGAGLERRLRRLSTHAPAAIIVGNGSTNDLSFIRSLGRRGIPTIHLVADRLVGSFSRYGLRIRLPAVLSEPEAWLDILERVAGALHSPAVLFVLSDEHCEFVSRHADAFRRSFRFVLPDAPTVGSILDKRRQYAIAEEAGIAVPTTFYPESPAELAELAPDLCYPVILKPYTQHVGRPLIANRKVIVVHTADHLMSAFVACTTSGARFMVQKIVAGGDEALFWYSGFWDEQCREQAWFTVQKLRQFPSGFGDGCLQRTVEMPAVVDQSRRLLEAFRYRGFVMVEFKRDTTDGALVLMEINPRTVSGNQLGISAGVDLPWIGYRHLIGPDAGPMPTPTFRANVTFVNEEWDVLAFSALWGAKQLTLAGWLRSLFGARSWGVLAWDDPMPILVGLSRIVRRLWRRRRARSR